MAKKTNATVQKMMDWLNDHLTIIPNMQKMLFVQNLYIMVRAGLSIVDALKILANQVENKKLQKLISQVKEQVEKGRQLSEVLKEFPKIFPPIYVSMIAAGEMAGKIEDSLREVSSQMKKSQALTSHIKGALIYPGVILTAMIGIGIEMVVFVLPNIISMFNDSHVQLPFATRLLVFIVNGVKNYGIFIAVGLVALISLLVWIEHQPAVRRRVHALNLYVPIFGGIIKKINLARFTMTLSSLLASAIPIIDAIRITASVESNITYREDLLLVSEALKKGESLSETLKKYPVQFPPMVVQMIMVGEQAGQLEQMLKELATYYSETVDETMKNFSTIIEPVIILLLGVAVAFIAVAVIMPMYSLAQSF